MENNLLTSPEPRRLEEVGRSNDPKYYPYHQLISYFIDDCFVLKGKLQNWSTMDYILTPNSVKAPIMIKYSPLNENDLKASVSEELADPEG